MTMNCGAKTRSGLPCKNHPIEGKARCKLHGGLSLSGKRHWNWKHGNCTNEARDKQRLTRAEIKGLILMAEKLGWLSPKPRVG